MILRGGGVAAALWLLAALSPLFVFPIQAWAEKPSALVSLRALQLGMTAADVESVLGKPDERKSDHWIYDDEISVTFSAGRLTSADADWKNPRNAAALFGSAEKFDSVGPAQSAPDTLPVEWVIGNPRTGHKWWILLDGRVARWHLGPTWKSDKRPETYEQIRAYWLKPFPKGEP